MRVPARSGWRTNADIDKRVLHAGRLAGTVVRAVWNQAAVTAAAVVLRARTIVHGAGCAKAARAPPAQRTVVAITAE